MTTTLLAGLLTSLTLNIGRGHHDVSLVETGRVFLPVDGAPSAPIYGVESRPSVTEVATLDAALPYQPQHIGIVMAGDREKTGWYGPGRPLTWADPIEIVRRLGASFHVGLTIEAAGRAPFHPGRCAAFLVDGQVIGYAGELHPGVVKAYGIPERTVAAEVDLDALIAAAPTLGPKPDFSTFPVAKEDIALVVDQNVTSQDLHQRLLASDPLIETVRLFDVYQGDQVPEGKKSMAFSLRLRAADRTLKDDEIKSVRAAALAAAATLGAQIRS